jgi:hypothetical protein
VTIEERRILLRVEELRWTPIIFYGMLALAIFCGASSEPKTLAGLPATLVDECLSFGHIDRGVSGNCAFFLSLFASIGMVFPFVLYRQAVVSKRYPRVRRSIEILAPGADSSAPGLIEASVVAGGR